jgi:hypothetical protein
MRRRSSTDPLPLAAAGATLMAVVCCAGLPVIGALAGGLTAAAVLGVAGGVLVVAGLAGGVSLALRARRTRACPSVDRNSRS